MSMKLEQVKHVGVGDASRSGHQSGYGLKVPKSEVEEKEFSFSRLFNTLATTLQLELLPILETLPRTVTREQREEILGALTFDHGNRLKRENSARSTNDPQTKPSLCRVAFVGDMGSGKSTLINALLQRTVSHQSGSGVGTTMPVEIIYSESNVLQAEVQIMSVSIVRDRVKRALDLLRTASAESDDASFDGDDSEDLECDDDPDVIMFHTLFPGLDFDGYSDADAVLQTNLVLYNMLGTSINITESDGERFLERIREYTSEPSFDDYDSERSALWPIVTDVVIKLNSSILRDGLVLLDLPGFGDRDTKRTAATISLLTECEHVVLCGRIDRITDNKFIKETLDLLRPVFRAPRGIPNFTIVATRADECKPDELGRDSKIGLRTDPGYSAIDFEFKKNNHTKTSIKKRLQTLSKQIKEQQGIVDELRAKIMAPRDLTEEDGEGPEISAGMKRTRKSARTASSVKRPRPATDAERDAYAAAMSELEELQRDEFNSRAEGERASAAVIQIDRKRRVLATNLRSNSIIEQLESQKTFKFYQNSSPVTIPIFCVGTDDFTNAKLRGGAPMNCFERTEDTGIPALRSWLENLISSDQLRTIPQVSERYIFTVRRIQGLFGFQKSASSKPSAVFKAQWMTSDDDNEFLSNRSDKTLGNPEDYRRHKGSGLGSGFYFRVLMECSKVAHPFFQKLHDEVDAGIATARKQGVLNASRSKNVKSSAAPMLNEKLHYQRLRAIIRSHGTWASMKDNLSVNVSGALHKPLRSSMADSLADHYSDEKVALLTSGLSKAFRNLLNEVFDSVTDKAFRTAIQPEVEESRREVNSDIGDLDDTLSDLRQKQSTEVQIGYPIEFLTSELTPVYDAAFAIKGLGSTARQRDLLSMRMREEAGPALHALGNRIIELLHMDVEAVEAEVATSVLRLAKKIDKNLALTWSTTTEEKPELMNTLRSEGALQRVLAKLEVWESWLKSVTDTHAKVANRFPNSDATSLEYILGSSPMKVDSLESPS